ncbi:hypothetical protein METBISCDRAFT_15570 [Metschnikowia bicuspidata]|uniref:TPR-like protein n=1 Tax=Metschnikowia bicuspidata TaxID=27322 RepID=A0A4P9ZCW7_9ASCO|nr:hypothetical protein METBISCDRAFT_15570 [Metschnikowia bicuspidata]
MSDPTSLIAQADKLAQPASGFFSFFGGSSSTRLEDASDLYVQAANTYRLQKNFLEAGRQFVKAAELQKKLCSFNDQANYLVEAYKCYKGVAPHDAIECVAQAIRIFLTQNGQFRRAANFQMDLAELCEGMGDVAAAAENFEKAGDYFSTDQAEALSCKAFVKAADLHATQGNYTCAMQFYDTVIQKLAGNSLSRWALKDHFFKAALCALCLEDQVEAQKRLDAYAMEDPAFASTREFELLQDIIAVIESGTADEFADRVYEFDQFSKLDKLKTQMLLKLKNGIISQGDDLT